MTIEIVGRRIDALGLKVVKGLEPSAMSLDERDQVFNLGSLLIDKGNLDDAEVCYLKCIQGLEPDEDFSSLPKCLNGLAKIYSSRGQYGQALPFIQAEKLFYENALIGVQKDFRCGKDGIARQNSNSKEDRIEERAEEFEKLSKLCMEEKKPTLALEYAAKALKLKKDLYGEDNLPKHMGIFSEAYSEVGKEEYEKSLRKYRNIPLEQREMIENPELAVEPLSVTSFILYIVGLSLVVTMLVTGGTYILCRHMGNLCYELMDELYFVELKMKYFASDIFESREYF